MDNLDLLKKDWKKQESQLPRLDKSAISKLLQKKSSSIVKWIFIISVLELVVPNVILLFTGIKESNSQISKLGLEQFFIIFYILYYIIVIGFIYLFFKNYKSISANTTAKALMQNIVKTRRVVKYYIYFHLALIPFLGIIIISRTFESQSFLNSIPENTNMIVVWVIAIGFLIFFMFLFWLFYKLLYGILLNRLKKNYKELMDL
ncbi:MAG: hypothetical protein CR989_00330 [Flavobacteriales bacterium]|nr:MAG: hypothetical protein CR989_00330 [Flavobacteriales bacterium]